MAIGRQAEAEAQEGAHREQALHRLIRQAVRGLRKAAVAGRYGQQLLGSQQVGLVQGIPAGGDPQRVLPLAHHISRPRREAARARAFRIGRTALEELLRAKIGDRSHPAAVSECASGNTRSLSRFTSLDR